MIVRDLVREVVSKSDELLFLDEISEVLVYFSIRHLQNLLHGIYLGKLLLVDNCLVAIHLRSYHLLLLIEIVENRSDEVYVEV